MTRCNTNFLSQNIAVFVHFFNFNIDTKCQISGDESTID
jgi:hypothetical protein